MVLGPKKTWRTRTTTPATSAMASNTAVTTAKRLRVAIIGQISWLRDAVDREGQFGAWPGVVRRLTCAHTAAEPEGVIQERLQELRRLDVGYERVVVGPVGHDFALCELVFGQAWDGLGDIVPVLYEHRVDAVQPFQRRCQFLLVVGDHTGQLPRHRRGVGEQADDCLSTLVEHRE